MILAVTTWVGVVSTQSARSALTTRLQMGLGSAASLFLVVWCLTVQRFPWPSRRGNTPELLVGGFREFPVIFSLLVLFLTGQAVFCLLRALKPQPDSPE
jgi:hypothetical protein